MKIEVTLEELKDLIRGDKDKIELFGKEYTISDQDRVIFKWVLDYKEDNHQNVYYSTILNLFTLLGGVITLNKTIKDQNLPEEEIQRNLRIYSEHVTELFTQCLTNYTPNVVTEEQVQQYNDSIKKILEEQSKRYEAKQQKFMNTLNQSNNERLCAEQAATLPYDNLQEIDSFELFMESQPFEYFRGIFDEFATPKFIEDKMKSSNYVVPNKCTFNAYKEYCNKHDLKLLESDGTENQQSSAFHARLIAYFRDKGWYFINDNGMDMDKVLNNFKNMNPVIFKLGSNNPCYYGFRLKEVK